GHLAADETGADHNSTARGGCVFAQRETFLQRTQNPDAIQARKRRNAPRHYTGRDHELVVAEVRSVVESHRLRRRVQTGGRRPEPQGDVVLVIELARLECYVVDFATQHLLRQRGPIVWQMHLIADDGEATDVARPAQLLSGPGGSQPPADYHYTFVRP